MALTPDVQQAIREIEAAFPDHRLTVEPDEQGGAYVVAESLALGDQYTPTTSWVGFQIGFQYPRCDVYPHFVSPDVRRSDGRNHAAGISGPTDWRGRRALQISRRSNRWDPAFDTAAGKLAKVLQWMRDQ